MLGLEPWQTEAMGQLVLAAVIGGSVGLEREYHGRAAGFRTHLLVCVGSCLVMILSLHFERVFGVKYAGPRGPVAVDPARLAYSVMTGVGFLGAGAIIKSGLAIRGLTTAASLWCIAAVGMACGFAMYAVAIFAAALILFSLFALNVIERFVEGHWYKAIRVTCEDHADEIEKVSGILQTNGVRVLDIDFHRDIRARLLTITYNVRFRDRSLIPQIYRSLAECPTLLSIQIE